MVDYVLDFLFEDPTDIQWTFESSNYTLSNDDFEVESLELQEGMCETSEFQIGTYKSSQLKVQVLIDSLTDRFIGERFAVSLVLDGNTSSPFNFCDFTVVSDKITSSHKSRELIMYDDLYKLSSIDIHSWYNTFMSENAPVTMKQLRDAFFLELSTNHSIQIEQVDTVLVNDDVLIYDTASLNTMLASDLLKCILHFNACNGMLNRRGKFKYIYLPDNQASVDYTVPSMEYYDCHFEEYEVKSFHWFSIKETAAKSGYMRALPGRGSELDLTGNFLWYKSSLTTLRPILDNIVTKLGNSINFTPFELERKGNPCVECGDIIQVTTDLKTFKSVIISRTLKGLQGLVDTYTADSEEYISNDDDLKQIQDTTIGYIGDSAIAKDEEGHNYIDQANCAWKLRSYPVDEQTGERYYTYLTKNAHLTVSNSETEGHSAENDRAGESTIGSSGYPWKAGYFQELYLNGEPISGGGADSACRKVSATLLAANWSNNAQTLTIQGILANEVKQCIQISPQQSYMTAFINAQILVTAQSANSLTFSCTNVPNTDIPIYVVIFDVLDEAEQNSF